MYEITGAVGGIWRMVQAQILSDPSVGSLPVTSSDFYSHSQAAAPEGRLYVTNGSGADTHLWGPVFRGTIHDGASEQLRYISSTGNSETLSLKKTSGGTDYVSGDSVDMDVFRRTKQTSGTWGTAVQSWSPYTSQTYNCDFGTYDYLFDLQ